MRRTMEIRNAGERLADYRIVSGMGFSGTSFS